jgi:multiple sugar transport system ATP-binding protein
VHFTVDAPPVLTEDTRELARDREAADQLEDRAVDVSTFVARLDPRAEVRVGDTVALVVDTTRVHLFDPEDGRGIY